MGLDSRRPPLPAPTESMDEHSAPETELATNVTTQTDKTSYSIPEDGSPITISTGKVKDSQKHHGRTKSQTSLLIEYFEASKTGDKSRTRPSVRVKVTPSAKKQSRGGNEAIQITGIGTDRKPSYTRRISLGNSSKNVETGLAPYEASEVSHSSGSNVSGRPPVEIEVLHGSDVSNNRSSRGLMYAPVDSNVSSMPPESLLAGERSADIDTSRMRAHEDEEDVTTPTEYVHTRHSSKPRKSSRSSRERSTSKGYDYEAQSRERKRRSSRSQRGEEDTVSGAESSLLSSNLAPSQRSYHSGSSQASRMTNNPKLLEMVENTIKRMILPEINAIKEDQKVDRKLRKFSESGRDSVPLIDRDGLERRVSKSSSTPNISSKPKVVLNRDGDDPGVVLSRGDSERVKHRKSSREGYSDRPSSRRSSGRHSREGSYDDAEEKIRHKSSRSGNGLLGAAAAGLAGGALTAAALKHHDSQGDIHSRRKKRSKSRSSRSRSASINETSEEAYTKTTIPPMPLASQTNDSEVTRESILSQGTDNQPSAGSATPVREISRGSLDQSASPASSRTPTRTPTAQTLGMSLTNRSIESPRSQRSPNGELSNKERLAALTAAGLGGAAIANRKHVDADGYGESVPQRKISSPVQSVTSLRKNFEDEPLIPQALRPQSVASRSSAGRLRSERNSQTSLQSAESSPTTKLADSRKVSQTVGEDEFETPLEHPAPSFARDGAQTPNGESADEWFERQHLVNDRYRDSMEGATNRDSYQTNPYPQDEKRFTMTTDDSFDRELEGEDGDDKDVHHLGSSPNYVHTPVAVESAVASLMDPSTISSNMLSSNGSSSKANGTYSDRMARQLQHMGKDAPPMYEGSTISQTMPSSARWAAIKGHARNMSGSVENVENSASPSNSPRHEQSIEHPVMGASGLPLASDPMPEIGHFDDSRSDLETNPSIIQGPLGGDVTGKDTWPYTPDPHQDAQYRDSRSMKRVGAEDGMLAAAAAANSARQAGLEDENTRNIDLSREATPVGTFRDEGYVTDGRTRSAGGITPKPEYQQYGKKDLEEYARAMDAQDLGDDPFTGDAKHTRHFSGNSHGMDSPLYDSSTGKGMDRIESKDVVALMDHLTVRDAQRNARDTEILVTLVRSAAEMRQNFDEMKKIIAEQDKIIMHNMERSSEHTAQKVLNSPRAQQMASPRTIRRPGESEEDVQSKRKGVLKRALKGLTGGKSGKDLAKIEDMLMQILDNVEDLKLQQGGGGSRGMDHSTTNDSLDSYEKLRNAPDSGYEPEGQAGTSSTPSQSGHFNVPPREKHQFHSGYDGRRGSEHRVSTVLEDDEDELEPHETHVLNHQFENNERMLTPTQENHRSRGLSPTNTPPQHGAAYNNTPDKQRKHKSNSSSLFGVPKISRWSRTTASSAAPDPGALDSPKQTRYQRPSSESSRSHSTHDEYDDDGYSVREDDRLRSTQSLAKEQAQKGAHDETRSMRSQGSKLTRTPSPLIPSEPSGQDEHDVYDDDLRVPSPIQEDDQAYLDDPKYHAHRNSLLLQHPQPRPGATPRHQNHLETQAHTFDDATGTNSDLSTRTVSDFDPAGWGSSGTAGLARHRLTQQVEPISPISMASPRGGHGTRSGGYDDGPLVPQPKPTVPPKIKHDEPEDDDDWDEPLFSNSGFSKGGSSGSGGGQGGYYSSPYGSGHLLEPIEEVRYSLETDSGRISPEPQVASARAVPAPARKITGPRPMGSRSSSSQQARVVETMGTVRRKPVPGQQGSTDSLDSETF